MPSNLIVTYAGDLALAGTTVVLLRRGLAQRYRAWWAYLVLQLLRDIALAAVPFTSLAYARLYMATEVIVDVVLVLSVYEWFRLLAGHYPGIKLAGTWFLNVGLGISLLICLATMGPDLRNIDWAAPSFYLVLLVKRITVSVLSVFALLVFAAFYVYRVRVRPNVIWHGVLLTSYLWLQCAVSVADMWSRLNTIHVTNAVRAVATMFLYLGWAVLLTSHGEEVEMEDRLTEDERYRLDRLNEELLILARRSIRGA